MWPVIIDLYATALSVASNPFHCVEFYHIDTSVGYLSLWAALVFCKKTLLLVYVKHIVWTSLCVLVATSKQFCIWDEKNWPEEIFSTTIIKMIEGSISSSALNWVDHTHAVNSWDPVGAVKWCEIYYLVLTVLPSRSQVTVVGFPSELLPFTAQKIVASWPSVAVTSHGRMTKSGGVCHGLPVSREESIRSALLTEPPCHPAF